MAREKASGPATSIADDLGAVLEEIVEDIAQVYSNNCGGVGRAGEG